MKKKVTVAIPVYNGEKFILQALNSVINQSVKVDNIVICDNKSHDKTIDLVNEFILNHKEWNIKLIINDKNIGFQNNFIKCYDLATTDFLLILHVDDILKKHTIEKQLNFFHDYPDYAVVGGQGDIINSNGVVKVNKKKGKDQLFRKNDIYEFIKATSSYIHFSTVMYNLRLTNEIAFFEEESVGPDELYWPILLQYHPIAVLSDSLIENRLYEGQMHVKNSISMFDKYIKHFEDKLSRANFETTTERQNRTRKVIRKQVATMSINIGQEIFVYNKNYKMAMKYLNYGIKQYGGIIFTKFFIKSVLRSMKLYK